MTDTINYESLFRNLLDAVLEGEHGREIDEGCNGSGPVAEALIATGKTYDEANQLIWGDNWENEE